MDKIFRRIIDNHFSELKGTTVNASVPVPEALINEVIRTALQGDRNISYCQISIDGENQVSIKLKTRLLPWSLHLKLKLDRSVDFVSFSSPKIRAWLENNLLLGKLGAFFNMLPEGIRLYG